MKQVAELELAQAALDPASNYPINCTYNIQILDKHALLSILCMVIQEENMLCQIEK